MLIHQAYKFRAYPTTELADALYKGIGCARLVYNLALAQHNMFSRRGRKLSPMMELPELKKEFPFIKTDAFSQCLQQALRDLDKAFERFFKGISGYPQPRRKYENDSMRFPQPYAKSGPQIILGHNSIKLPKFGWLKIIRHRKIKGQLRNVTVKLEGDQWFVIIQTELNIKDPMLKIKSNSVGLDIGVNQPITTSAGEVIQLPQVSKEENCKRKILARSLNRKKKGSNNRNSARIKLRAFDRYLANRRKDACQKTTSHLVKNHGLIGIEDLHVQNMTASAKGTITAPGKQVAQKAGLNRRILDVAPGEIRRQLEYKGVRYGAEVIAVPPAFTSQDCSYCGMRNSVSREMRVISCVACGVVVDRDWNAARNIEMRAIDEYSRRTGGVGPWIELDCWSEVGILKEAVIPIGMWAEKPLPEGRGEVT